MIIAMGSIILAGDTGRLMLGLRSESSTHAGTWSFFGGKLEGNEIFGETLDRELAEEVGRVPGLVNTFALDDFESPDGRFKYLTYVSVVRAEFTPALNHEHDGYCWVRRGAWPKPLHGGARRILHSRQNIAKLEHLAARYA